MRLALFGKIVLRRADVSGEHEELDMLVVSPELAPHLLPGLRRGHVAHSGIHGRIEIFLGKLANAAGFRGNRSYFRVVPVHCGK